MCASYLPAPRVTSPLASRPPRGFEGRGRSPAKATRRRPEGGGDSVGAPSYLRSHCAADEGTPSYSFAASAAAAVLSGSSAVPSAAVTANGCGATATLFAHTQPQPATITPFRQALAKALGPMGAGAQAIFMEKLGEQDGRDREAAVTAGRMAREIQRQRRGSVGAPHSSDPFAASSLSMHVAGGGLRGGPSAVKSQSHVDPTASASLLYSARDGYGLHSATGREGHRSVPLAEEAFRFGPEGPPAKEGEEEGRGVGRIAAIAARRDGRPPSWAPQTDTAAPNYLSFGSPRPAPLGGGAPPPLSPRAYDVLLQKSTLEPSARRDRRRANFADAHTSALSSSQRSPMKGLVDAEWRTDESLRPNPSFWASTAPTFASTTRTQRVSSPSPAKTKESVGRGGGGGAKVAKEAPTRAYKNTAFVNTASKAAAAKAAELQVRLHVAEREARHAKADAARADRQAAREAARRSRRRRRRGSPAEGSEGGDESFFRSSGSFSHCSSSFSSPISSSYSSSLSESHDPSSQLSAHMLAGGGSGPMSRDEVRAAAASFLCETNLARHERNVAAAASTAAAASRANRGANRGENGNMNAETRSAATSANSSSGLDALNATDRGADLSPLASASEETSTHHGVRHYHNYTTPTNAYTNRYAMHNSSFGAVSEATSASALPRGRDGNGRAIAAGSALRGGEEGQRRGEGGGGRPRLGGSNESHLSEEGGAPSTPFGSTERKADGGEDGWLSVRYNLRSNVGRSTPASGDAASSPSFSSTEGEWEEEDDADEEGYEHTYANDEAEAGAGWGRDPRDSRFSSSFPARRWGGEEEVFISGATEVAQRTLSVRARRLTAVGGISSDSGDDQGAHPSSPSIGNEGVEASEVELRKDYVFPSSPSPSLAPSFSEGDGYGLHAPLTAAEHSAVAAAAVALMGGGRPPLSRSSGAVLLSSAHNNKSGTRSSVHATSSGSVDTAPRVPAQQLAVLKAIATAHFTAAAAGGGGGGGGTALSGTEGGRQCDAYLQSREEEEEEEEEEEALARVGCSVAPSLWSLDSAKGASAGAGPERRVHHRDSSYGRINDGGVTIGRGVANAGGAWPDRAATADAAKEVLRRCVLPRSGRAYGAAVAAEQMRRHKAGDAAVASLIASFGHGGDGRARGLPEHNDGESGGGGGDNEIEDEGSEGSNDEDTYVLPKERVPHTSPTPRNTSRTSALSSNVLHDTGADQPLPASRVGASDSPHRSRKGLADEWGPRTYRLPIPHERARRVPNRGEARVAAIADAIGRGGGVGIGSTSAASRQRSAVGAAEDVTARGPIVSTPYHPSLVHGEGGEGVADEVRRRIAESQAASAGAATSTRGNAHHRSLTSHGNRSRCTHSKAFYASAAATSFASQSPIRRPQRDGAIQHSSSLLSAAAAASHSFGGASSVTQSAAPRGGGGRSVAIDGGPSDLRSVAAHPMMGSGVKGDARQKGREMAYLTHRHPAALAREAPSLSLHRGAGALAPSSGGAPSSVGARKGFVVAGTFAVLTN